MKKYIPLAFSCFVLCAFAPTAGAQTLWNVASGDWATPGNWNPTTVPGAGTDSRINNTGTATLSTDAGTIGRVRAGAAGVAGHLIITSSGTLAMTLATTIASGGSMEVSGVLSSDSVFNVGSTDAGTLTINSGGSVTVTGNSANTSNFRIATGASSNGTVTVDGGTLNYNQTMRVGANDNSTATLTVKNNGLVKSTSSPAIGLGGTSDSSFAGVTATLNIGGETTAATAGRLDVGSVTGYQGAGTANTNVVNFNHTSDRYEFVRDGSSDAILLGGNLATHLKAGVTVLTGASTYTGGTIINAGTVLLANSTEDSAFNSSTGQGTVTANGTLGGIGWVNGATTVTGTLRPGDYAYDRPTDSFEVMNFRDDLTLDSTSTTVIALAGTTRGTDYTGFDVAGDLSLDGELKIDLLTGFSIADGETLDFQIFNHTGTTLSGAFASYDRATTWGGLDLVWDDSVLDSTGVLSVTAVPEPTVGALLAMSGLLVILRNRRRNRTTFPSTL